MNRIDAGNFSRRFVDVPNNRTPSRRNAARLRFSTRTPASETGANVGEDVRLADDFRNANDAPNVEEKTPRRAKLFFDVESKTIVTIGKYEKDK